MKLTAHYILFALVLLISGTISDAQTPTTNSATHRLPRMTDINRWRANSRDAIQRGAEQGDTDAMMALYFAYAASAHGSATPDCDDCKEAKKWLTKAAEAGNAYAQCLLGICIEEPAAQGSYTPPPNMPEAVHCYQLSAEQGWAGGEYRLALCYLRGKGVEQDEERALELLRKAADQDHIYGLLALAGCYAKGIGTPRNDADRPMQLLKCVAASRITGDNLFRIAEAYDRMIFRYEYGVGVQRDIFAAAEWYCRAALKGVQHYTLADKIELAAPKGRQPDQFDPILPDQDYIHGYPWNRWDRNDPIYAALSLYLKAARGDANAMMRIGELYLTGDDVPNDPAKARVWFMLASQKGVKEADSKLSSLGNAGAADTKPLLAELVRELEQVSTAIH